ncbi:MAG: AAA family ATPase [Gemmatimonadetes bacterium]|nr:AAA family ATPase [Gemmatimonadota bacterium]MYK53068.1 AAA family ATPase [Gemmatimonadota bacterium]
MLTKLICRKFKRFEDVEIELGNPVVFIGPNNSGKTAALQALALWDIGLKRWNERYKDKTKPEQRPGVAINRRDLISIPVSHANLLWRNLHVRDVRKIEGRQQTQNIRIEILVEGVTQGEAWKSGLEFDYANQESFYCRPLRLAEGSNPERMPIPKGVENLLVAFLPPMSGLTANETRLDPGAINVRIGEGRTAEVLRNLCYQLMSEDEEIWVTVCKKIHDLFGVDLDNPIYIPERGEIEMTYRDRSKSRLDLSSSGRGLQQTLLLFSYLAAHPESVLLLDEPDAHLEILRQRQIYQTLTELATQQNSQIIAASHSEVILNEAADRDVVVAFLGRPHRIDDRGSQLLKFLRSIGFEQYYQAEQRGWVLYLEGSTDLAILQAFAEKLNHPAQDVLERPFVMYVDNQPGKAREHFYGLREAKQDLIGFALFDQIDQELQDRPELREYMWKQREIENYLCKKEVLMAWAEDMGEQREVGALFASVWKVKMEETITEIEQALKTLGKGSPWGSDTKVSDDFLDPLFESFFQKLSMPNLMQKTNYHTLSRYVPKDQIDPEISTVLDAILEVAEEVESPNEETT